MNTEQKIALVVVKTLIATGVKPGDDGVLNAVKDAVVGIHLILKKQPDLKVCEHPECTRECHKCSKPDCPVQSFYRHRQCS